MNINNPTFIKGKHQFADNITTLHYKHPLHTDLASFIPEKNLSIQKKEAIDNYLSSIEYDNIDPIDWWDILYTIKKHDRHCDFRQKEGQTEQIFFQKW